MKVLVFDTHPTRLQTTVKELSQRFEVTGCHTEQELSEHIPYHQVIILTEEIDLDFVAEKIRQFPAAFFFIVMKKKLVEGIRNFMAVGVKECFKFPLTLEAFERAVQSHGISTLAPTTKKTEIAEEAVKHTQDSQPIENSFHHEPQKKEDMEFRVKTEEDQPPSWGTEIKFPPKQSQSTKQIVLHQGNVEESQKKRSILPFKKSPSAASFLKNEEEVYPSQASRMAQSYFSPSIQQILAVTSARGGVGKTTITYNMAVLAKQRWGLRTVVIDADHRGNLSPISNTRVKYNADHWRDLNEEEIVESTVFDLLNQTNEEVYIVPAGKSINGISGETMRKMLSILKRYFQMIFIDCQPFLSTGTVEAYQQANKVMVVATDDITTFPSTIELIHQLRDQDGVGINPAKINLVLNKVGKDFKKEEEEILVEKTGYSISGKLLYTQEIKKRLKNGQPIALYPKSVFTKKLQLLMENVMGNELNLSFFRKETGFLYRLFKRA